MDNQERNTEKTKEIIRSITDAEALVIGVPVELIHFIGDTSKAVVLAQLIFMSDKGKRTDGYVYKTYAEMFELTGIKEGALRSYFKRFRELGFFYWTVKRANGLPTIHFKFLFSNFEDLFNQFLRERNLKKQGNETSNSVETLPQNLRERNLENQGNETSKIEVSLTENTTENTNKEKEEIYYPESELRSGNVNSFGEGKVKVNENKNEKLNYRITSDENNNNYLEEIVKKNLRSPAESAKFLTKDFFPSLENQYWAITNYPTKSPKRMTESFIDYYSPIWKSKKLTESELQNAWRNWLPKQFIERGYSKKKLADEIYDIKQQVKLLFYKAALYCNQYFMRESDFFELLGKEEYSFSKDSVKECLNSLIKSGVLKLLFNKYYYLGVKMDGKKLVRNNDKTRIFNEWNEIDKTLLKHLEKNYLANYDELINLYLPNCIDSIDLCLESGVLTKKLVKVDNHYYLQQLYKNDEDYRINVDTKLKTIGFEKVISGSNYKPERVSI
jgi:hypothetical protein